MRTNKKSMISIFLGIMVLIFIIIGLKVFYLMSRVHSGIYTSEDHKIIFNFDEETGVIVINEVETEVVLRTASNFQIIAVCEKENLYNEGETLFVFKASFKKDMVTLVDEAGNLTILYKDK